MNIGEQIRNKRQMMKMTAKDLSERSGVPEKTIYRIEKDETPDPKISSLRPLIEALGCTADEIIMDREKQGLSGLLHKAFERSDHLPPREKAWLINFINRWVNNVETEILHRSPIDDFEDAELEKMVANEIDAEEYEEYERHLANS